MRGSRELLHKGVGFTLVSGLGWLLDFALFLYLAHGLLSVGLSNVISSFVAVSLVFFLATRKVFAESGRGRLTLGAKYVLYLVYQVVLIGAVSLLAEEIYTLLISLGAGGAAILLAKCLIAPVTLLCNFFVMRFLVERL